MGFTTKSVADNSGTSVSVTMTIKMLREARFLIVSEDDSIRKHLSRFLSEAGFVSKSVNKMTEGCRAARSGRFQVVFTTPLLSDGSWRRLVEIATHCDLGFVVIVVATTFDLKEWAEALEVGAFDVLDAVYELPKAAEIARRALWAAYLKGAGPYPRPTSRAMAA